MKKVSMVVINYNEKLRIERAINSCINQTWNNKEIIIVDDGSTEDVRKLYEQYKDEVNVKLIQLERTDKTARTPSNARNKGFEVSTGEYVCFLDSDNYFDKNFVTELMKDPTDVMFSNWEIVGKQQYKVEIEKVWSHDNDILQNYLQFTHLDHGAILFKREILEQLNDNGLPYDERLPRSQDCDVIIGSMLLTRKWKHTNKSLFIFEKHEEDQMKTYASVHGKTLWSLKRGLNIQWLMGVIANDPNSILSFYHGIKDFTENEEWKDCYNNSEFKTFYEQNKNILTGERKETV